jgi:hypothetical protein
MFGKAETCRTRAHQEICLTSQGIWATELQRRPNIWDTRPGCGQFLFCSTQVDAYGAPHTRAGVGRPVHAVPGMEASGSSPSGRARIDRRRRWRRCNEATALRSRRHRGWPRWRRRSKLRILGLGVGDGGLRVFGWRAHRRWRLPEEGVRGMAWAAIDRWRGRYEGTGW